MRYLLHVFGTDGRGFESLRAHHTSSLRCWASLDGVAKLRTRRRTMLRSLCPRAIRPSRFL